MSKRSIFIMIVVMLFVSIMGISVTLLVKDKVDQALEVLAAGAFVSFFILMISGAMLLE